MRSEEPGEHTGTRAQTAAEIPLVAFALQVPNFIVLTESYGSFNVKKRS